MGDGTLLSVTALGDRRASLEALRDRLAIAIDDIDPRYLAPLAKQLSDVLTQIAALPSEAKGTALDELASRRAGRGPNTTREARPARR